MADFAMDLATQRLVFRKNDLAMTTGVDAVKQAAFIRLRMRKKEWLLDPSKGLLDFDNLEPTKAEIRATLLDTPGMVSVESIELTRDQTADPPTLFADIQATCTDGPLDLRIPVTP